MTRLFLFLFCSMLFATSCTKDESISRGTAGDLSWKLAKDGTLVIFGKDIMPNYLILSDYDTAVEPTSPWYEHRNDITKVIIGNDVSIIGNCAFSECSNLATVTIGNSVFSIGKFAFSGCFKLTSITIGNSITDIGTGVFARCQSLTEIVNERIDPQSINSNVFGDINLTKCTLFVPAGSEKAYRVAEGWKDFGDIKAIK